MGGASCDRHNPDPAHHRLYSVCIRVDEMSKNFDMLDMRDELMFLRSITLAAFKKSTKGVIHGRKHPEEQVYKAVDHWETKFLGAISNALYYLTCEEPVPDESIRRMFELLGLDFDELGIPRSLYSIVNVSDEI